VGGRSLRVDYSEEKDSLFDENITPPKPEPVC